jgi:hypothetical protein
MAKNGSFRQWMAVLACACLVACGGGGGSDDGGSGGGRVGGRRLRRGRRRRRRRRLGGSAAAITASLATGSYLEFLATAELELGRPLPHHQQQRLRHVPHRPRLGR